MRSWRQQIFGVFKLRLTFSSAGAQNWLSSLVLLWLRVRQTLWAAAPWLLTGELWSFPQPWPTAGDMTSAIKSTEESVSELEKGVTAAFGTPGSNDQKHFICFFSLMEDFKRKLEKWESVHCSSYGPRWFLHP